MVQGVAGVTGLQFTYGENAADAATRVGPPADPRHGQPGELHSRYAWDNDPDVPRGPYGLDNQLLGFSPVLYTEPAGSMEQDPRADLQPLTRAAPWPAGVPLSVQPDDSLPYLAQANEIRSRSFGASRIDSMAQTAVQDEWVAYDQDGHGDSLQVPIPQQAQVFGANRDRVQSNARQNEYGFDGRRGHRRVATGAIPGNYDWLKPGSRPMVHARVGTAIVPTGPDTPFAGQVAGDAWTAEAGILTDLPAPYAPAATPAQAAAPLAGPVPSIGLW